MKKLTSLFVIALMLYTSNINAMKQFLKRFGIENQSEVTFDMIKDNLKKNFAKETKAPVFFVISKQGAHLSKQLLFNLSKLKCLNQFCQNCNQCNRTRELICAFVQLSEENSTNVNDYLFKKTYHKETLLQICKDHNFDALLAILQSKPIQGLYKMRGIVIKNGIFFLERQ